MQLALDIAHPLNTLAAFFLSLRTRERIFIELVIKVLFGNKLETTTGTRGMGRVRR